MLYVKYISIKKISHSASLLSVNSISFCLQKYLFCLHLWKILVLSIEFHVDNFLILPTEKCFLRYR